MATLFEALRGIGVLIYFFVTLVAFLFFTGWILRRLHKDYRYSEWVKEGEEIRKQGGTVGEIEQHLVRQERLLRWKYIPYGILWIIGTVIIWLIFRAAIQQY